MVYTDREKLQAFYPGHQFIFPAEAPTAKNATDVTNKIESIVRPKVSSREPSVPAKIILAVTLASVILLPGLFVFQALPEEAPFAGKAILGFSASVITLRVLDSIF